MQAQRSAVSLMLAAPEADIEVRVGDSLRADAFAGLTVDAVLSNPPYGDRDWGHDELAYDSRWAYGVPPRAESELAWVQHALAHLVPGGHAVMLLPPATASRASGRRVRMDLVRSGAVRTVIALPPGAAAPLHVGLQIWVLQRPEPAGPERKTVLFIDTAEAAGHRASAGSASGTRGARPALDWPSLTEAAMGQWSAFTENPDVFADEPGTARAVPVVDLLDDLVDLTPARHVRASRTDIAPADLARETEEVRRRLVAGAASLGEAARYTDWGAAGPKPREWRTATAADLARGGALTLLRTAPDSRERAGEAPPGAGPVLTGQDIARGTAPSGDPGSLRTDSASVIATGDVLVRAVAGATVRWPGWRTRRTRGRCSALRSTCSARTRPGSTRGSWPGSWVLRRTSPPHRPAAPSCTSARAGSGCHCCRWTSRDGTAKPSAACTRCERRPRAPRNWPTQQPGCWRAASRAAA